MLSIFYSHSYFSPLYYCQYKHSVAAYALLSKTCLLTYTGSAKYIRDTSTASFPRNWSCNDAMTATTDDTAALLDTERTRSDVTMSFEV